MVDDNLFSTRVFSSALFFILSSALVDISLSDTVNNRHLFIEGKLKIRFWIDFFTEF